MGFRRSADHVAAAREWRRFLDRHAAVVAAVGLPLPLINTVAAWDEFLMHGFRRGDITGFDVTQLDARAYEALVQLAVAYFSDGNDFYAPLALRPSDQAAFQSRFGAPAP